MTKPRRSAMLFTVLVNPKVVSEVILKSWKRLGAIQFRKKPSSSRNIELIFISKTGYQESLFFESNNIVSRNTDYSNKRKN